ncbi:capsular polysaccharide synthesis protein [Segatella copri]|uniref:capsular polysaccharide synthesis protein n=1 Tax=Segatella copri TaxID=165179 RepID=UPI003CFF159A
MNNIIFGCKVIGGAYLRMFRFSKHFGWNVAWNLFCNDVRKYFSHSKSSREKANAKHHEVIENYLCAKGYGAGLSGTVSSNHIALTENVGDDNIWVCWWQGEKSMPEMVKKCFNSIIRYSNGHPVKLITFDNYKDYVQVDHRIVDKVKNGTFKLAHFADLVRLKLLEQYGGLWLDSTILLTANISEDFFQKFFSVKIRPVDNDSVSEYRWCSFVLGGGKNIRYIYSQLSCMLERYMLENDVFIDYLLIDYFLDILYRQDKSVKETIDTMPFTNPNLHKLRLLFENEFDEISWKTIVSNTNIFKLTYKGVHSRYTKSGIPTFYGHILCTEIP